MKMIVVFGGGGIADGLGDLPRLHLTQDDCDVRDRQEVSAAMELYSPDVVIVTAGVSSPCTMDRFQSVNELETNLIGSFNVAAAAVKAKVDTLIFVASVAGLYGKPGHAGYSASKAGVISLVQSLGMEGHKAYAISPGRVDTNMRERDYPNDTPGSRLEPYEIGRTVHEIMAGQYQPGDNIIVRKQGLTEIIREIDRGEPWRKKLKVGEPVTI